MQHHGLSAIVANADHLGLVQKSEVSAGQDDKAGLREYQLHATEEIWSYIPSTKGNIPEPPPQTNPKSSRRKKETKTMRISKDVLLLLVESADRLNQAQAQMEYRKALKEQAKAMKKNNQPYEAEVLDDIVRGIMPAEIQQLVEAEENAMSEAKMLSDQTGGRRVMHKMPTMYRDLQTHIGELMAGKQANQRWGYFGGLQKYVPPFGINGPSTEAEAVQSIVNPDVDTVTASNTKRPETLSNDNWWTIMQKRKKATLYSQKLAEYRERMDFYKQHFAARYIQRCWRAWKTSRTMDASDELDMLRAEIARRKKMEVALRTAAEGAWHLAGNQRRLVARQHTVKRPVGFGSSLASRRLTLTTDGDSTCSSRPLSRATNIPFSYSRRQTGSGLEGLPSMSSSRSLRRSGTGYLASSKSNRGQSMGSRSMRPSASGVSGGQSMSNRSSGELSSHHTTLQKDSNEDSDNSTEQPSPPAVSLRRHDSGLDTTWRSRRLQKPPSTSEPGTGTFLEELIEEEDEEGTEDGEEDGNSQEQAGKTAAAGSKPKAKRGTVKRRKPPPLSDTSPTVPPPSAPATTVAPSDANTPRFEQPTRFKKWIGSGSQGDSSSPSSPSSDDDTAESPTAQHKRSSQGMHSIPRAIKEGNEDEGVPGSSSSSTYDSRSSSEQGSGYGSSTQEEAGGDGQEDGDDGYVTADEEDLEEPGIHAAVMQWELDRAFKAGDHAKVDVLRDRAAAAAKAAAEAAAKAAAEAAAREAEAAAAKAARARARSALAAHNAAMQRQKLEEKNGLSLEALGVGGMGGIVPVPKSAKTEKGKGEIIRGRSIRKNRHSGVGIGSNASGELKDPGSNEMQNEGHEAMDHRKSAAGMPVHLSIAKPLNIKKRESQPDATDAPLQTQLLEEFPEAWTPPPSPALGVGQASAKASSSATMVDILQLGARPSAFGSEEQQQHRQDQSMGVSGTRLQPSLEEQQRSFEHRREEERLLAKRLYPTGWHNVGDMCILEKDDDEVIVPQEGPPIFADGLGYRRHSQGFHAPGSTALEDSHGQPKWQGPQFEEGFAVGAGGGGNEGKGRRGRIHHNVGVAAKAVGEQGDESKEGHAPGEHKEGSAGLTLKGEKLDTEGARVHWGAEGQDEGDGRGPAMSTGQLARQQARQAAAAKAAARQTAHHARYGALAAAHDTLRPVPPHLTRFPAQFKMDSSAGPDYANVQGNASCHQAGFQAGVRLVGADGTQPHHNPDEAGRVPEPAYSQQGGGFASNKHMQGPCDQQQQQQQYGYQAGHPQGAGGQAHQQGPDGQQHIQQQGGVWERGQQAHHTQGKGGGDPDATQGAYNAAAGGSEGAMAGQDQGEVQGALHPQHPPYAEGAHRPAVGNGGVYGGGWSSAREQQPAGSYFHEGYGYEYDAYGNRLGAESSVEDRKFEVMYRVTRLAQAPPSSPRTGLREGDIIELHIEGHEEEEEGGEQQYESWAHPGGKHHLATCKGGLKKGVTYSSVKGASQFNMVRGNAFTAALAQAAAQIKNEQPVKGGHGVRIKLLDPVLEQRVQQWGPQSHDVGQGRPGWNKWEGRSGGQQHGVQAVNLGLDVELARGQEVQVGALGPSGMMGRQARRRSKIGVAKAAKLGTAKGGGRLQVGGTGWIMGAHGMAVRQPVGQEAVYDLQQNLGVQKLQLRERMMIPPRCLPRFRQRGEGRAMSLRVRAGTELSAVMLPLRRSAGQVPLPGQEEEAGLESHLTLGQRQQRFRRRQHQLRQRGFVVVRAQRWGGGVRPHMRAMMMGPARRMLLEARQELEALECKARALEPKAEAALLGRMLTTSLGAAGHQQQPDVHTDQHVADAQGALSNMNNAPVPEKGQQQQELKAFGTQMQLQPPLAAQMREMQAQAQALAMDPRSAYSPHYLKLAERYPELLLPTHLIGKPQVHTGHTTHQLSTSFPPPPHSPNSPNNSDPDATGEEPRGPEDKRFFHQERGPQCANDPGNGLGAQIGGAGHSYYSAQDVQGRQASYTENAHEGGDPTSQGGSQPSGNPIFINGHPRVAQNHSGAGMGLGGLVRGAKGSISTAALLQQINRQGKVLGSQLHGVRSHRAPPHKADLDGMLIMGKGSSAVSQQQAGMTQPHGAQPAVGGRETSGSGRQAGGTKPIVTSINVGHGQGAAHHGSAPLPGITEHQRTSAAAVLHPGAGISAVAAAPSYFTPHTPSSPPAAHSIWPHSPTDRGGRGPEAGSSVPSLPRIPRAENGPGLSPMPPYVPNHSLVSAQAALQRHYQQQQALQQGQPHSSRPAGFGKAGRIRMGSTAKSQPVPSLRNFSLVGSGSQSAETGAGLTAAARQLSPTGRGKV